MHVQHARTHARVFADVRAGIPAEDGGCYLALDSLTYQASCQLLFVGYSVFCPRLHHDGRS
jgi:hypothetical protein